MLILSLSYLAFGHTQVLTFSPSTPYLVVAIIAHRSLCNLIRHRSVIPATLYQLKSSDGPLISHVRHLGLKKARSPRNQPQGVGESVLILAYSFGFRPFRRQVYCLSHAMTVCLTFKFIYAQYLKIWVVALDEYQMTR